jgi:arsenate reductase
MRNVLFICTGNSARSIMAEALLNHWGGGHFRAFSAGSAPRPEVHPMAIAVLKEAGLETGSLLSKGWNEFAPPGAPSMDFVFTVCSAAAKEACPIWPGHPVTAHWNVDDPAAVNGDTGVVRAAFIRTLRDLEARIKLFVSLPIETSPTGH